MRRTQAMLTAGLCLVLLQLALPAEPPPSATAGGIRQLRNLPLTGVDRSRGLAPDKPVLLGDRHEYWADDEAAQFYLLLPLPGAAAGTAPAPVPAEDADDQTAAGQAGSEAPAAPLADELHITLSAADGGKIAEQTLARPLHPKTHFLLDTAALAPGRYKVAALLRQAGGAAVAGPVAWEFVRSAKAHPALPFPAAGLTVEIEPQTVLPQALLPLHFAVPLPRGMLTDPARLTLEENGSRIPAQITPVAYWGPGGAVRLAHVHFAGRAAAAGQPSAYRLRLHEQPQPPPAAAIKVVADDKQIVVDNGSVRFVVNRKAFNGIDQAWYDPAGQGNYELNSPAIVSGRADAGPYLVDGRLIRFDASADKNVRVEVEEQGPVQVTVVASGWYANGAKRPRAVPLCQFKTRITCHAGQPAIRVRHHTVFTFDTRTTVLADAGFHIPVAEAGAYRVGIDGASKSGELPAVPAKLEPDRDGFTTVPGVALHQDRSDHVRLLQAGKLKAEGRRADGWATLDTPSLSLTATLRDIWQKFPKELELSRRGLTLHFWPASGHRAFAQEDELALRNIYKFWCFHQHGLLNLTLSPAYFDALTAAGEETSECRPSHALNGNGEGLAMGNEFEIRFSAAKDELAESAENPALRAALFQQQPAARLPAEWNAASGALGPVAAADKGGFALIEDTIIQGMSSYNASVERGENYGMWIWPDTHTYWLPAKKRASLHRVWQNSHYQQVGNSWRMWYRGAPFAWLRWTRDASDHYRNVSTINYAGTDDNGRARFKFHTPGAMYHCKGCTPWGSEAEGMTRHDTHASIWGHWVDPEAHLLAWQLDAEPRARDLYELWLDSVNKRGLLAKGTAREANSTMGTACTAYETTWNADFIPVINNLGKTIMAKPLETQNPGPLWNPLWVNRYYHLTRDPAYVPFILKYGRTGWMGNTFNLGMAALAYELSGDATYLTQMAGRLRIFCHSIYRQPGDPYDGFGFGPGPLGFGWIEASWGTFLHALNAAGIRKLEPGEAELAAGATVPLHHSGRKVTAVGYALKLTDRPWKISFSGFGIDNDMNRATFRVFAPDGAVVHQRDMAQAYNPRWTQEQAADGKTGVYRLELTGYGAFNMAATDLDAHAAALKSSASYTFPRCRAYLQPLGTPGPVEITFAAAAKAGDRKIANISLRDIAGNELCRTSLASYFNNKKVTVKLDPAVNPLPWLLDGHGAFSMVISGGAEEWLLAPGSKDLELLRDALQDTKKKLSPEPQPGGNH